MVVVVEEVPVEVQRVDRVELGDVHEVEADVLVGADPDRVVLVVEGDGVRGVDLVLVVEVRVEPVHHDDELPDPRLLRPLEGPAPGELRLVGVALGIGVDDEGPVEPLVDVSLQGDRVAVVEVAAEGEGVELVDGGVARLDHPGAHPGHPVHRGGVDPVEVDRVRVGPAVGEVDTDPVPFIAADRRPGDAPVVDPGGEEEARGDLDLLVLREDAVLAERPAVGELRGLPEVPVVEELCGVEAVALVIHLPDGGHQVPVVGGKVRLVSALSQDTPLGPRDTAEDPAADDARRSDAPGPQEVPARQPPPGGLGLRLPPLAEPPQESSHASSFMETKIASAASVPTTCSAPSTRTRIPPP